MNIFDKDVLCQAVYEFYDMRVISYGIPLSNVYIVVWFCWI